MRDIEILVRLFGAYHDGYIELTYSQVHSYTLSTPINEGHVSAKRGHGDWLIDEIRLSNDNYVIHEIAFDRKGHWLIECQDINYQWLPLSR